MRPEMRRTMTLSEQLATPDPAIRDFLKIPQDDADAAAPHEGGGGSPATARDDADGRGGMMNWKPLRDRLRLRRAANAWHTPHHAPKAAASGATTAANNSNNNRSNKYNYSPGEAAAAFSRTFSRAPSLRTTPTFSRVSSTRVGPNNNNSSRSSGRRPAAAYEPRHEDHEDDDDHDHDDDDDGEEEEEEDDEGEEEEQGKTEEEAPAAQMSLMALLEQSDDWDDDEDEEGGGGEARKNGGAAGDDDEDDGEGREEEMVHVCCVCMVRHKGAAFIPCGHTFCRLCSRELWVSRGNCPLCNGFIQEILDIF